MTYYKSAKGKESYKKKLKKDVKRSTSKEGLKKRAELKRLRTKLNAPKNKATAVVRDVERELSRAHPVDDNTHARTLAFVEGVRDGKGLLRSFLLLN